MNIVIVHAKKEIEEIKQLQKFFPKEHDHLERLKLQWESLILQQTKKD